MTLSTTPPRQIAIAFYGITRSLKFTIDSIRSNVMVPARAAGKVKVFCHFFAQDTINNPRTGEVGDLDVHEWELLKADHAVIEAVDSKVEDSYVKALMPFGNAWEDNGQSLRNILRQLISLKRVTQAVQDAGGADLIIFLRADMQYHDVFPVFEWLKILRPETVMLPHWQWSGGLNDRFAMCGREAYSYYGLRVDQTLKFCINHRRPMHSERLLMDTLMRSPIQLATTPMRATRIRSNGTFAIENFNRVKIAKRIDAFLRCNVVTRWMLFRIRCLHEVHGLARCFRDT